MAHLVIPIGAVLKCLELIPESVNYLVGQHCQNGGFCVRTMWHMKMTDYLFDCVTVMNSLTAMVAYLRPLF